MNKKKNGFFSRMRKSDNPAFEIGMFSISVAIALAVLVGVLLVGWWYIKGQTNRYTEEEVNAGTVTQAAVEVDKTEEEPVQTVDPNQDMIENDELNEYEDELKNADFAYTTSDVNMRSEASLTASVISKVPFGTEVKMISYDGGDWAKVSYQGVEGYINAMYLSATKPVPVMDLPAPIETVAPTKTPKPKKTPKPEETVSPDETEEPDYPEETEKPEETEAPPEKTEKPAPTEAPAEKTEKPAPTEAPAEESE